MGRRKQPWGSTEADAAGLPEELKPVPGRTTISPKQAKFLRGRVLNGLEAWRCCNRKSFAFSQVLGGTAAALEKHWEEREFEALAPGGGKQVALLLAKALAEPTVIAIRPAILGTLAAVAVVEMTAPQTKHALEVVVSCLTAIEQQMKFTSQQSCYDCAVSHMLGQTKVRAKGKWHRQAAKGAESIESNPIKLRTPHA